MPRIRILLLLLSIIVPTSFAVGQGVNTLDLFKQAGKDLLKMAEPVSDSEKRELLAALNQKLAGHVSCSGTSAAATEGGRKIEWKGFGVSSFTEQALTAADRENGIQKRWFLGIGAKMHRVTDSKGVWSEWRSGGLVTFPSGFTVEKRAGSLLVRDNIVLRGFSSGSGSGFGGRSASSWNPSDGSLPPGMSRTAPPSPVSKK